MSWLVLKHLLSNPNHKGEFIGMGNPEAKILFVGQECAIDGDNKNRTTAEISENWNEWDEIINNKGSLGYRHFTETIKSNYEIKHNPLRGQEYRIQGNAYFTELKKMRTRINKASERGLGATWYNYAKIVELVKGQKYQDNYGCTFFNDCFMTELSDKSAATHAETNSKETSKAVANRATKNMGILTEQFFQGFDIVICAAGSYLTEDEYKNLFPKARILIITPQLNNMSDELARWIAMIINSNEQQRVVYKFKLLPCTI